MDKHKLLKKVLIIILIVAAGVFLADWAMGKYKFWQETKKVDKLAQALRDIEKKDYEMAMADTFGGQTPQETLEMFIKAVEKGDYELASKYFVLKKQESWKQSLVAIKNQPAIYDEMLVEMKFARNNTHQKIEGDFAWFSYTMPGEKIGEQLVFERIFNRWKINVL